jgi:carbonic anhydrase/acetyltransferase-like protein (isoleucine patch superfamily)
MKASDPCKMQVIKFIITIGIGAIVLNGAHVKKGSVVAVGSVVREGQVVGPYQMVAGAPAKVKRELDEETLKPFLQPAMNYLYHAAGHREIEIISK